jgi:hypothetical protein
MAENNLFKKNTASSVFLFFIISIIISIGTFINLSGCAERKIAVDLVDYVNHGILDIASLETAALKKYASVTGTNYKGEHDVYETLKNDVIPVYKRFFELLKKIQPDTDEIAQLHLIYINGAEMLYKGFVLKKQALETKNVSYLIYANKQIEKGRIETERWRNKLFELYKKAGVKEEK